MADDFSSDMGFKCGSFWVALSAQGYLLPGSKSAPLRRSSNPSAAPGRYRFRAKCDANLICDLPVEVLWTSGTLFQEEVFAIKVDNAPELETSLRLYSGKVVILTFDHITPAKEA